MKSVKPGRGPSALSAVVGIAVALFGVFWTILAISGGAAIMAPFGIIFIIIAIVTVIYNIKNATGKERYSDFDIVDSNEEGDPFNRKFGSGRDVFDTENAYSGENVKYCPYCGKKLEKDFEFCPKCGRRAEK